MDNPLTKESVAPDDLLILSQLAAAVWKRLRSRFITF